MNNTMQDEVQNEQSTAAPEQVEDFGLNHEEIANKGDVNKKISKIVSDRLRSVNQKRTDAESRAAKAEAERDAWKQQHDAMLTQTATPQQAPQVLTPEMQQMVQQMVQEQTQQQQMHADAKNKLESFHNKLNNAASQDPELNTLVTQGNHINDTAVNLLSNMGHIENMPAVVKHLLKDKGDHAVFTNASTPAEAIKYVNDLSKKLSGEQNPSPSNFKASPTLTSSPGTSSFDAMAYMNETGHGRKS